MRSLARRGRRLRAAVLALALMLALFQVAAAGHRHDSAPETHPCAICAVLLGELPCPGTLPPIVAAVATQSYVLLRAIAYVCHYLRPLLTPPSCGPPMCAYAT